MAKTSPAQMLTLNFRMTMAVMNEVAPRVRALKLEMKEFFLLAAVDEHANPAELARELMLPKPSVTFMVKRMEAAGYLRRELQQDDLRRFRLTLTPAGRRALEKARGILDEAFGARLARLSAAERAELASLLERMAE
jgi:DNA-binding MarR family transcriptional regulator